MLSAYFTLAAIWCLFVLAHQRRRYLRKSPYFVDTFVEHFVLFPVGFALYLSSEIISVDNEPMSTY